MTAEEIHNRQFRIRFRGFDVREVDQFLDETATAMEALETRNQRLQRELRRAVRECRGFRQREASFRQALRSCEQSHTQLKENAQKTAKLIIAEAEVKAERILNKAHARLSQIHDDISELKRQRKQIEAHIQSIIETHTKMLALGKEEMNALDSEDTKLKLLNMHR